MECPRCAEERFMLFSKYEYDGKVLRVKMCRNCFLFIETEEDKVEGKIRRVYHTYKSVYRYKATEDGYKRTEERIIGVFVYSNKHNKTIRIPVSEYRFDYSNYK